MCPQAAARLAIVDLMDRPLRKRFKTTYAKAPSLLKDIPCIIPGITPHTSMTLFALETNMLSISIMDHTWHQTMGQTPRVLLRVIPSIRPRIRPCISLSHRVSDPISHQGRITPKVRGYITQRIIPSIIPTKSS